MGQRLRSVGRWALMTVGLLGAALAIILLGINTPAGRGWLERQLAELTGGEVVATGLAGRIPDAFRLDRLELKDTEGVWLVIEKASLDWSPLDLLAGEARGQRLTADRVALPRLPVASDEESSGLSLRWRLAQLKVDRLELGAPIAGQAATLAVEGKGWFTSIDAIDLSAVARRLDGPGDYVVEARISPAAIEARLSLQEPAQGLASALAGIPDVGDVAVESHLFGPRGAVQTSATFALGPLRGDLTGRLDVPASAMEIQVNAASPAMHPAPQLAWEALDLHGTVSGPWSKPSLRGILNWDQPKVGGASARSFNLKAQGDAGEVAAEARLEALRIPGSLREFFASAPVIADARVRLDMPGRPVSFALHHPGLAIEGTGELAAQTRLNARITLPELAPLMAAAGLDLRGNGSMKVDVLWSGKGGEFGLDGRLGILGGTGVLPGLIGRDAKLSGRARLEGETLTVSGLKFEGQSSHMAVEGTLSANALNLDWKSELTDLALLSPTLAGQLAAKGTLKGQPAHLNVSAGATAALTRPGVTGGAITASLDLKDLPGRPVGHLKGEGRLDDAPLRVSLALQTSADGQKRLDVEHSQWKSAVAQGSLLVSAAGEPAGGQLELQMDRLDDLRGLLGFSLSGRVDARLSLEKRLASLQATAFAVGVKEGPMAEQVNLEVSSTDPLRDGALTGEMSVTGFSRGDLRGAGHVQLSGTMRHPEFQLNSTFANGAGDESRLDAEASLDVPVQRIRVASLHAGWKQETLQLAEPVRVDYGNGIELDRLRLLLQGGDVLLAGRVWPRFDLSLSATNLPADIGGPFSPWLNLDGKIQLQGKLLGDLSQPQGHLQMSASGLRSRVGAWRSLPPGEIKVAAELEGTHASLDAGLQASDKLRLQLTGAVPLSGSGEFDLRADGNANLSFLDPLLTPGGQRLRGKLGLQGRVAGPMGGQTLSGHLDLEQAAFHDELRAIHLTGVTGQVQADEHSVRIVRLDGKAGPGMVSVVGSLQPMEPDIPIDLKLTATDAQPLASDRLTVDLNANLTLRGHLAGELSCEGRVRINRADVRIPERMPSEVAVLKLSTDLPEPIASTRKVGIGLDLKVTAPRAIFVRGRGLDAELGGRMRLLGAVGAIRPEGQFELIRGTYSLAGQNLSLTHGILGFNNDAFTDPTLDFKAQATHGGINASVNIGGTAQKPTIKLSSSPELPSDEVLANLLFGHGTASLSPFELAQIANAAVSLTGISSGIGNPLERVRTSLGLDRLSMGTSQNGSPTLEGGRYVSPGVYVGTKQGVTGTSGTQGTIQVDVLKGLKLEGSIGNTSASGSGSGAGSGSVGVIYQFEY